MSFGEPSTPITECFWRLETGNSVLMNGRSSFEVYLLPFALDDALTNLCRRPTLLVQLVGIVNLFEAGGTAGPVRVFKAAMQAVMAHAVAIAIAGLLVK